MNQHWDPEQYGENARFVSEKGMEVVEWLAPKASERILDLGCGDGVLTEALIAMGCEVVGVDASPAMVAAAKARGVDVRLMDGGALVFDNQFDAVFSNAALHWMQRPEAVIAGVWRVLRPGGRFVGECGGHGNVATIVSALEAALARRGLDAAAINPWFFPTAEDYRQRLEACRFSVEGMVVFPRPIPLPGDMAAWLETFAQAFISALPLGERRAFIDKAVESLRPALCNAEGHWTADYVRLRFFARKS